MYFVRPLKTLLQTGDFCARHFVALLVTVGVECGLWTVAYFALLFWAAFTGSGLGSPAAFVLGFVAILIVGTLDCVLLLLPSTTLAEWHQRRRGYSPLVSIPISVGILALHCLGLTALGFLAFEAKFPLWRVAWASTVLLLHLVPLGLYWWTAQAGPVLLSLVARLGVGRRD